MSGNEPFDVIAQLKLFEKVTNVMCILNSRTFFKKLLKHSAYICLKCKRRASDQRKRNKRSKCPMQNQRRKRLIMLVTVSHQLMTYRQ